MEKTNHSTYDDSTERIPAFKASNSLQHAHEWSLVIFFFCQLCGLTIDLGILLTRASQGNDYYKHAYTTKAGKHVWNTLHYDDIRSVWAAVNKCLGEANHS